MPGSIEPTWRATFRWGSGLSSELYSSSATCMTARLRLPLLFAGVRGAFFRSVPCPLCLLELKTPVPKLAQGTEACLPGDDVGPESRAGIASFAKSRPRSAATSDSGSHSPTSAQLMRSVRPVFFVVLPLLVVLDEVVRFAAAADDSGWWPSEFGSSSLLGHYSSEGVPRLLHGSNRTSPGAWVLSSVFVLRWVQKTRSIDSLGAFKDHHMRTCLLFVIRIISASRKGSSEVTRSKCVPCVVASTSIRYPNPRDKILSMPASRFARVDSVSYIQETCLWVCHGILSIPAGSGLLGRTSDGRSTQRWTERGPARAAGAVLAYMVHLCGPLGLTYDYFSRGRAPQPQ